MPFNVPASRDYKPTVSVERMGTMRETIRSYVTVRGGLDGLACVNTYLVCSYWCLLFSSFLERKLLNSIASDSSMTGMVLADMVYVVTMSGTTAGGYCRDDLLMGPSAAAPLSSFGCGIYVPNMDCKNDGFCCDYFMRFT